jgi:cytoskeletal protein RodZ
MFCFGVGVFMLLVKCFVLELVSLCSWLNVLFWSWHEHEDANSKTKQSTRNIKTPTPDKRINQEHEDANSKTIN